MDEDMRRLLQYVVHTLDGINQHLTRARSLGHEELTDLRDALRHSAATIQTVRDITDMRKD